MISDSHPEFLWPLNELSNIQWNMPNVFVRHNH